jgi:carbon-monoxide dehydrogenase iron sulfur subunit
VGCLQCRLACAVEHSQSKNLAAALLEPVKPVSRVAVYPGRLNYAFPSKCRHCDPAPCEQVCIAGAIFHDPGRGVVDIDPWRCINCGMCAMACPFGVLRYAATPQAAGKRAVALKCDQCPDREAVGRVPACVEACKVGALTYGDWEEAQAGKAREFAQAVFAGLTQAEPRLAPPDTVRLWRALG